MVNQIHFYVQRRENLRTHIIKNELYLLTMENEEYARTYFGSTA